jgi:hypothetical protein
MALYVPASRRRRRTFVFVGLALGAGLLLGGVIGRATAPDVDDRLRSVRSDARQTAAGLRVIAIHDESDTAGNDTQGAELVLRDTREELQSEFDDAPWLTTPQRGALLQALDALEGQDDKTTEEFGQRAEGLAQQIETTFGVT